MELLETIIRGSDYHQLIDITEVSTELLEEFVAAGQLAPYIGRYQGVHIVLITDKEKIKRLNEILQFIGIPGLLLVTVADTSEWEQTAINGIISSQNMYLVAISNGLAAVWHENYETDFLKPILVELKVETNYEIVSIIAVGKKGNRIEQQKKRLSTKKLATKNVFL